MPDASRADPVVSGVPYEVMTVNGQAPVHLNDFFVLELATVGLVHGLQRVIIRGATSRHEGGITVYEKTDDGHGRDVRSCLITQHSAGFNATEQGVF
jgi:hypothetical protein